MREHLRRHGVTAHGLLAVAAACLLVGPATAETTFLQPGDTGRIEYPIDHLQESAASIEGLTLSVTAPAHFIVKETSVKGPLTAAPNESKTFFVDYEIAADAPDGASFDVTLSLTATTEDVDPELASLSFVASFNRNGLYPSDGKAVLSVFKSAPFGVLKLSSLPLDRLPLPGGGKQPRGAGAAPPWRGERGQTEGLAALRGVGRLRRSADGA